MNQSFQDCVDELLEESLVGTVSPFDEDQPSEDQVQVVTPPVLPDELSPDEESGQVYPSEPEEVGSSFGMGHPVPPLGEGAEYVGTGAE